VRVPTLKLTTQNRNNLLTAAGLKSSEESTDRGKLQQRKAVVNKFNQSDAPRITNVDEEDGIVKV
jgi:hypothetical protein